MYSKSDFSAMEIDQEDVFQTTNPCTPKAKPSPKPLATTGMIKTLGRNIRSEDTDEDIINNLGLIWVVVKTYHIDNRTEGWQKRLVDSSVFQKNGEGNSQFIKSLRDPSFWPTLPENGISSPSVLKHSDPDHFLSRLSRHDPEASRL